MNLVGYLRVSSDGQVDGFGLETQEKAIRRWCRNEGHRLVAVVADAGVSGATDALDRPGFCEVLRLLTANAAQGLILARLDRLARALTVQEATLALLWSSGVDVFTADSGRVLTDDPDDPMRTALRQVVGVFSELERRMVIKRLRDGRTTKARTGRKAVGAYPFGYVGGGRGRDRDAVPDPEEQAVVGKILAARAGGQSFRTIASMLDALGIKPRRGQHWSAMSVRAVVLREQR